MYTNSRKIIPAIEPITDEIITRAFGILEQYPALMARDALHAATCFVRKFKGICSYDSDFDVVEGLNRIVPK